MAWKEKEERMRKHTSFLFSLSLQFRAEVACLHCFSPHRLRQSCSQVERSRLPRARQKNCNQFRLFAFAYVAQSPSFGSFRLLLKHTHRQTVAISVGEETNANQFWDGWKREKERHHQLREHQRYSAGSGKQSRQSRRNDRDGPASMKRESKRVTLHGSAAAAAVDTCSKKEDVRRKRELRSRQRIAN